MRLLRRLTYWLNRRQRQQDLAEELDFHADRKRLDGTPHEMGSLAIAREDARAVWIWPWCESIAQDLRYALRSIRLHPAFALTVVATLAAAIGLNTSFFTVFNALALRPWPVPEPQRVVRMHSTSLSGGGAGGFSLAESVYFHRAQSLAGLIAFREHHALVGDDAPKRTLVMLTSANYFRVLGVEMTAGRGFLDEEDRHGAPQMVAVLSHRVWNARFGADPAVIGRTIKIDDRPVTVVGIAGEEFSGTERQTPDAWLPFASATVLWPSEPWVAGLMNPANCCVYFGGRLAPGASRESAHAELTVLNAQFHEQSRTEPRGVLLTGTAFLSNPGVKRKAVAGVTLAFVAFGMILLLACANVGNLMLARATARRREIAVRLSLGAARGRIVRQLMTECLTLSLAGGAVGLWMASWLPAALLRNIEAAPHFALATDWRVTGFAALLSIAACIAFGLAPSLHGTRGGASAVLKESSAGLSARFRLRSVLLGVQVALSLTLLVGAALLVRGMREAAERDPGFRHRDVASIEIELPAGGQHPSLMRDLEAGLASGAAAMTGVAPLSNQRRMTGARLPTEDNAQMRTVGLYQISESYFDLLGIPTVAGRAFSVTDRGAKSIVVNETMARRFWPDGQAVGRRVFVNRDEYEVIGVARDTYLTSLDSIDSAVFVLFDGPAVPVVLVRAGAEAQVTALVTRLEPRARVTVRPLTENLNRNLAEMRMSAMIAGFLGLLALALAAVGIGGVFGYAVEQRTREIGIRMALGARTGQVIRAVLQTTARSLAIGLVAGLASAAALSGLLTGMLYGVSRFDPLSYAAASLLLAAAGIAASFAPARRATKIDPVRALRWE